MPVLSQGFAWPGGVFFEGAATAPSSVVPGQYPIAIAGKPFNIEPTLCRRAFAEVQRPAQDQETEPGEASLSPEGLWRRSQSDWSLGAGQTWLDEEESVRRRFFSSLGCDVMNDREVRMLPATEEKRNSANTNLKLLVAGQQMYVMDGANLVFGDAVSDEQDATWPTTSTGGWTAATGLPGGTLLDMVTTGSHVYVLASDNSIYRAAIGAASFAGPWYNPAAVLTRLYTGLGRLFGSVGNQLYEITQTPGETLIFTHPDPNFTFTSLCAAPTGVYFTGQIGTSGLGEMRHTWIKDDGTAFVAPVVVAEFINEPILSCEARGNVMLIGTQVGFRFALIQDATTGLTFGPPVPIGPVRDIVYDSVGAEVFAWATWTSIQTGISGLVRIRPSRQTETLVPAYAADIYASSTQSIITVASLRGRRYFGASADGFFGATANKVPTATLRIGRIRYGLLSPKIFSTMQWRTSPLTGTVSATATVDDDSVVDISTQAAQGTLGIGPVRLPDAVGEWIDITFTFTRSATDATKGPTFRWWVMRSLPTVEGTERHVVALRFEQKTQTPLGPIKPLDCRLAIEFLAELIRRRQVVKYQRGKESYDVYVVNMEERPERWEKMDHGFEGILMVEMQTVG